MATVNETGTTTTTALRRAVGDLEKAARAEGIAPDGPLGVFVAASGQVILRLDEAVERVQESVTNNIEAARDLGRGEIEKLQKMVRLADIALQQAKSAELQLEVRRETVVATLVERIGPELSDEIKNWRVLKQTEYTLRYAYRTAFWAVLAALTLAATCYFGRAWEDREATAVFARCLANPVYATKPNATYCDITRAFAETQGAQK